MQYPESLVSAKFLFQKNSARESKVLANVFLSGNISECISLLFGFQEAQRHSDMLPLWTVALHFSSRFGLLILFIHSTILLLDFFCKHVILNLPKDFETQKLKLKVLIDHLSSSQTRSLTTASSILFKEQNTYKQYFPS